MTRLGILIFAAELVIATPTFGEVIHLQHCTNHLDFSGVWSDFEIRPEERVILSQAKMEIDGQVASAVEVTRYEIHRESDGVFVSLRNDFFGVMSLMVDTRSGRFWRAAVGRKCSDSDCTKSELKNWTNEGRCAQ